MRKQARDGEAGAKIQAMFTANGSVGRDPSRKTADLIWEDWKQVSNTKGFRSFEFHPRDDVEDGSRRDKMKSNTPGEKQEGLC